MLAGCPSSKYPVPQDSTSSNQRCLLLSREDIYNNQSISSYFFTNTEFSYSPPLDFEESHVPADSMQARTQSFRKTFPSSTELVHDYRSKLISPAKGTSNEVSQGWALSVVQGQFGSRVAANPVLHGDLQPSARMGQPVPQCMDGMTIEHTAV